MNNFKLNADAFDLGASTIKVSLADLPDDIKVVDAVLSVKVQSVTTNSEIPVHYSPIGSSSSSEGWDNVDNVILSADDILKINISDELQDALLKEATHLQLNFGETDIVFDQDSKSDFINIDYTSLAEFQNNGSSHKINLGKSGQASVDLVTGRLSVTTPIVATDSNALPLSISANYHAIENAKLPEDTGMPKNWHLNVNQFLIKETDPDGDLKFTYIDENGKNQIIEEKYYYLDGDDKTYVERNNLEVDLDGNYIYGDHKIKTELIAPSGLKLVSSIADIPGSDLVDYEPEELITIKNNIKSYEENIQSLKKNITSNKKQLLLLGLSKFVLDLQVANQNSANQESIHLRKMDLKYHELNIPSFESAGYAEKFLEQHNGLIPDEYWNIIKSATSDGDTLTSIPVTIDNETKYLDMSDAKKVRDVLLNNYNTLYNLGGDWKASSNGSIYLQKLNQDLQVTLYETPKKQSDFISYIKSSLSSYDSLFDDKNLDMTEPCIHFTNSDYNEFWDQDSLFTLGDKDVININLQIKNIISNNNDYIDKINQYNEQVEKLKHQQEVYELQVPVHYLYNDSNVIYGFGKTSNENTFRLILITDAYENTIIITYESLTSNKIESITDASHKTITFEYDETTDYLSNIVDARERKTSFICEGTLLKEIDHNEKQILFAYDSENKLQGVLSPAGTGAKFTYDNNQVTEVQAISIIDSIEHDNFSYKAEYDEEQKNFLDCLVSDSLITFIYNNYQSTSITNTKNKRITYLFDKYGKVRCIYENSYTGNMDEFNPEEFSTKVNNYDYEDNNLNLKVSKLPYSIDYLEDVHFESDSAIEYLSALSLGSLICGDDCTPYSYPVYKDYYSMGTDDNSTEKVSVTVSNDMLEKMNALDCNHKTFMLSGWAKSDSAFIITDENLDEFPDYIKDRKFEIRAEITYIDGTTYSQALQFDWRNTEWQYCALPIALEDKIVSKFECFIDYSNNTNIDKLVFTDLELKQGDYEKTEYNSDNLPIKKSSGHSEWTTSYEYDENHNLISKTITSNNTNTEYCTTYEYNKYGKLIKSIDYNGIAKENVYNDKGSIIKSLTYHKDEPANILCEEKMLDDKGNETYTLNEFGEKVSKFEYIEGTGIQSATIDNDDTKTAYGYDEDDTLLQTSTTVSGAENTNIYGYTLDTLTSLTHNNFDIKYSYDDQGRKTKIQIADAEYLNKSYGEFEEITNLKTGESYKQTFDKNGNVLEVYYKSALDTNYSLIIQNIYDIYGNLVYCKDLTSGTEKIHTYDYDNFGQVISEENTQHEVSVSVVNEYDDNHSNIDHATIEIDGTKIEYDYSYSISPDSKLERITSPLGDENVYYDKLGRVHKTELSPLTKEFSYLKKGSYTSNLVSKINFATNNAINDSLTYKYDEKGNITEVRQYNELVARYKYDALSRIIREDNKKLETTTTFEYDAGGNILCKKVYTFTIIDNLDFEEETQVVPYTYPISSWRDQLLEFNGEKFEYDAIGNPVTYRNKPLVWSHGRQLNKFADIVEFTYNASGIRTSKTYYTDKSCQCEEGKCDCLDCTCSDSFTTKFFLNGNKIIKQHDCCNDLTFYYGADGLTGFHIKSTNAKYNDEDLDHDFYYKKNLQGDIIGIIDTNGEEIVKYVYDAWGNHKAYNAKTNDLLDISSYESYINTSNLEQFIAIKNPFRYRSYYYDFETGLYYLNSRYYDPELGRFINADDTAILSEGKEFINGLNLYAYCNSNPVMHSDQTGAAWWNPFSWDWKKIGEVFLDILATAAVAVVVVGLIAASIATGGIVGVALGVVGTSIAFGAVSGAVSAVASGTSYIGGLLSGAVNGASTGIALGLGILSGTGMIGILPAVLGAVSVGFLAGNLSYAIDSKANGKTFSWEESITNGGLQSLSNLFAFGTGYLIGGMGAYNVPGTRPAIDIKNIKMFLTSDWFRNFIGNLILKATLFWPINSFLNSLKY